MAALHSIVLSEIISFIMLELNVEKTVYAVTVIIVVWYCFDCVLEILCEHWWK